MMFAGMRHQDLRQIQRQAQELIESTLNIARLEKARIEAENRAQIQEQAQRMQQIVDTVPEGLLLLDANGRVVLANPVAQHDLGILAGAKIGDTLTRLGNRPLAELLTSPPKGLWHEVTSGNLIFEVVARPMESGPKPEDWVLPVT